MTGIAKMVTTSIQTLSVDKIHDEQKKDIHCRHLAAQSHRKNKNSFNVVMISPDCLLQKQQYIHGLRYDVTIIPYSIIPVILHEYHNSKEYQDTLFAFEVTRRFYWWSTLHQDIVKHIKVQHLC